MSAEELVIRFGMEAHVENGAYIEKHYPHSGEGRAASGSIYYYVAPDELTEFHVIDCDEYWCFTEGSPLDVWLCDPRSGSVTVKRLGTKKDCEPLIYVPKGVIFASKHRESCTTGTFLTCITVPRFSPEGFSMISKEDMIKRFPAVVKFYEDTAMR